MPYRRTAILLAATLLSAAQAQQPASAVNKARDDASIYVSTGNFIVGRIAHECLALVGRSETPQEFVGQWRQRNARYVSASAKYMDRRMEEAEAGGGPQAREALLRDLRSAVQGPGETLVRNWLQNGRREESCMRAVTLLDTGALDISSRTAIYDDLEALVRWAAQ